MKIELKLQKRMTLEKFADINNLVMEVHERLSTSSYPKFYAKFKNSETKRDIFLVRSYGNGDTKEEAIEDYCKEISNQTLVIDAYGPNRKEIQIPILEFNYSYDR